MKKVLISLMFFISGMTLGMGTAIAALVPAGPEFQVNTTSEGRQQYPAIAMVPDGSHVITWKGPNNIRFGQFYNSSGIAAGSELQFDVEMNALKMSMTTDGVFVATWRKHNGIDYDYFARRYSTEGIPIGNEFQIGDSINDPLYSLPSVFKDGSFITLGTDG